MPDREQWRRIGRGLKKAFRIFDRVLLVTIIVFSIAMALFIGFCLVEYARMS